MSSVTKLILAITALLSFALLFGWESGIILLVGVGIHEYGHMWAMKFCGVKTKGFYFLPFLGGVTIAEEEYRNLQKGIFIALMGPVWGFGSALLALLLALQTNIQFFYDAAYILAWLNLVNLIPIFPLDGGRVLAAMSVNFSKNTATVLVYGAAVIVSIFTPYWIICIIGMAFIGKELARLRTFRPIGTGQFNVFFGAYIASIAALGGVLKYLESTSYFPHDLHIFFA